MGKYLKYFVLFVLIVLAVPSSFAETSISETYVDYAGGHTYYKTDVYAGNSIVNMQAAATSLGGYPLVISNAAELKFLAGKLSETITPGTYYNAASKRWVNANGESDAYINSILKVYENPKVFDNSVLCVYATTETPMWWDIDYGRLIVEVDGIIEWKDDMKATEEFIINDNREYNEVSIIERQYVNSAPTSVTRKKKGFNTKTTVHYVWKLDGKESSGDQREIFRLYIDDNKTERTKFGKQTGYWKVDGVEMKEPYYRIERFYSNDTGKTDITRVSTTPAEQSWKFVQFESAPPYRAVEQLYLDGKSTDIKRTTEEIAKQEWVKNPVSLDPPYRYTETLYVAGEKTDTVRDTGKTAKAEHKPGLENVYPYRYFTVLHLDGVNTKEVTYTGKNAKAEWKQLSLDKKTGIYAQQLYLDGKKTEVTKTSSGTWQKSGSKYVLYVNGKSTGVSKKGTDFVILTKSDISKILNKTWYESGYYSTMFTKAKSGKIDGASNIVFSTLNEQKQFGVSGESTWISYYYEPYRDWSSNMGWHEDGRYTIQYRLDGQVMNFYYSGGMTSYTTKQKKLPASTGSSSSSGSGSSSGATSSSSSGEVDLAIVFFERPKQLMNSWDVKDPKITTDNYKLYINNSYGSCSIGKGTDTKISGSYTFSCIVTDGEDTYYPSGTFYLEKGKKNVTIKFNLYDGELSYSVYQY